MRGYKPGATVMRDTSLRALPVGAEVLATGGVHFRVWAPLRRSVDLITADGATRLEQDSRGYFSGLVRHAGAGALYRFRLDGGAEFPDPASRFQPEGPHGPSQVIDPSMFSWT